MRAVHSRSSIACGMYLLQHLTITVWCKRHTLHYCEQDDSHLSPHCCGYRSKWGKWPLLGVATYEVKLSPVSSRRPGVSHHSHSKCWQNFWTAEVVMRWKTQPTHAHLPHPASKQCLPRSHVLVNVHPTFLNHQSMGSRSLSCALGSHAMHVSLSHVLHDLHQHCWSPISAFLVQTAAFCHAALQTQGFVIYADQIHVSLIPAVPAVPVSNRVATVHCLSSHRPGYACPLQVVTKKCLQSALPTQHPWAAATAADRRTRTCTHSSQVQAARTARAPPTPAANNTPRGMPTRGPAQAMETRVRARDVRTTTLATVGHRDSKSAADCVCLVKLVILTLTSTQEGSKLSFFQFCANAKQRQATCA